MENSEFDKFIQLNTEEEINVPDGLNWESMNIPLPTKKKRRIFFWFWVGGILISFMGGIFTYKNFFATQTTDNSSITQENKTLSQRPVMNNLVEKSNISTGDISQLQSKSFSQKPLAKTSSNNDQNLIAQKALDISLLINLNQSESVAIKPTTEIKEELGAEKFVKNNNFNPVFVAQIPSIHFLLSEKSFDFRINLNDRNIISSQEKNPKQAIFLSFGLNQYRSNYTTANQRIALEIAENETLGETIEIGWNYYLKNKFFVQSGVAYERLHSTFTYSEDLGTTVSFDLGQKTQRNRHIFHNNYLETVQLNLGLGRNFDFGKNWGSDFVVRLSPNYKIKAEGRTLADDFSVLEIEAMESTQRLFWSSDVGFNLKYRIANNNIFAGMNFKQYLTKTSLTENSTINLQPQIIQVRIGFSRVF